MQHTSPGARKQVGFIERNNNGKEEVSRYFAEYVLREFAPLTTLETSRRRGSGAC